MARSKPVTALFVSEADLFLNECKAKQAEADAAVVQLDHTIAELNAQIDAAHKEREDWTRTSRIAGAAVNNDTL